MAAVFTFAAFTIAFTPSVYANSTIDDCLNQARISAANNETLECQFSIHEITTMDDTRTEIFGGVIYYDFTLEQGSISAKEEYQGYKRKFLGYGYVEQEPAPEENALTLEETETRIVTFRARSLGIGEESRLVIEEYSGNIAYDNGVVPMSEIGNIFVQASFEGRAVGRMGACSFLISGYAGPASDWREYHAIKRGPSGQPVIIDKHPGFNHGQELEAGLTKFAHLIVNNFGSICGGVAATPSPLVENENDNESPSECLPDTPSVPFPEIQLGNRAYFAANPGIADLLMYSDVESDEDLAAREGSGRRIRALLESGGIREMDLTQTIGNPDASDSQKIVLGEGAIALILRGDVEILIPGETDWRGLKQDDLIPAGSRILTGMDSDLVISFPKRGAAKVLAFSDFILNQNIVDESCQKGSRTPLLYDIDLREGEVEFRFEPRWNYQPSMQVRTPNAVAGVRGTHFWVTHDSKRNISAVGVYEGTVAVTDRVTGATMDLLPQQDGKPGIAVIGSVDTVQQDSGSARGSSRFMGIIITLLILGSLFIFYKTGKLQRRSNTET